jgi:hypothetical protein
MIDKIRAIIIIASERCPNGGSTHFSGFVSVIYRYEEPAEFSIHRTGYDSQYIDEAARVLIQNKILPDTHDSERLNSYCSQNKIALITHKYTARTEKDKIPYEI